MADECTVIEMEKKTGNVYIGTRRIQLYKTDASMVMPIKRCKLVISPTCETCYEGHIDPGSGS